MQCYQGQYWRCNLRFTGKIVLGASFLFFNKKAFRVGDLKRKLDSEEGECFQDAYSVAKSKRKNLHLVQRDLTTYDRTELGLKRLVKYGILETEKIDGKRFFRVTDKGHKLLADWYWNVSELVSPDTSVRLVSQELRKVRN